MSNRGTDHENVLPEAVRKQVAAADAIIEQMNADPEAPAPAPDPEPAAMPTDVPEVKDKQEAAAPKPEPEPTTERTDWKQKYLVLQDKYDKEVPRLHEELRNSSGHIRSLQDELSRLSTTVAAMQEVQKKPQEPPKPLVTQEEIDQFGPDLIDVVERVARQAVSPYVDEKFSEVQKTVKQVDESVASQRKTMAESARERLYERLDATVPGWDVINKDPVFIGWLREIDEFSGQPRGILLRSAFEKNDADRVVKFFKGFQKEHAVETSDPEPAAPKAKGPQQSLDELVAPGTPKTGSTGAQEESGKGRIWTQSDIQAYYARKNELIKANPNAELPEDMLLAERDIFKAQREGRIRA